MNAIKLTRLEKAVQLGGNKTWYELAKEMKTTPAAMQRAYERLRKKEKQIEAMNQARAEFQAD